MITSIAHTAYTVTDTQASMRFYRDILGFPFTFGLRGRGEAAEFVYTEDDLTGVWLLYFKVCPGQFIELFPAGEGRGQPTPGAQTSYQHLCLAVDDIAATVEEIRAKGWPIATEPKQGMDGNIQAWITDPDGNRIELMQMMPGSPQYEG